MLLPADSERRASLSTHLESSRVIERPSDAPDLSSVFGWEGKRVGLLFNASSGRSVARGMAERLAILLDSLGAKVPAIRTHQSDFREQMRIISEEAPDVVVAIGGDGTANAGATLASELDVPVLIVPAGTMNLLARDLDIPIDFSELIDRVVRCVERRVDMGEVNGRPFLHSSVVGAVPELARVRESMREAASVGQWLHRATRYLRIALADHEYSVDLDSERGHASRVCQSVIVTCNELADAGFLEYRRERLDAGRLGVYVAAHRGPLARARALLSLMRGKLRHDREVASASCERLSVDTRRRSMLVSNDGEVLRLRTPLEYGIKRKALRALVPVGGQVPVEASGDS
ncbi:MAG: hypothetical protein CMJ31_01145 [Phycisphaerae bacterium]|nr:hypothetical protein [Phycisphaerae bacterium]